jgi:hypothetical protein
MRVDICSRLMRKGGDVRGTGAFLLQFDYKEREYVTFFMHQLHQFSGFITSCITL